MQKVQAPAKVNLCLHITGKREDGYHELQSLVAFAPDCCDEIQISISEQFTLNSSGPFASELHRQVFSENLCKQAGRALAAHADITPTGKIQLEKHLPISSGIGGGSSDAAATLLALNKLWRLNLSLETLAEIGLPLGADVPVCLHGQARWMEGIGEMLSELPAPLPSFFAVLVNPGVPLATADIFSAVTEAEYQAPISLNDAALVSSETLLQWLREETKNTLQPVAMKHRPEIQTVLDAIAAEPNCALARMSGSGATCFGLFLEKRDATNAANFIAGRHPNWWVGVSALV